MQKFNNPLDNIKIASPCSADWNNMYGDNRKRFCSQCKLNVYNLSEMSKDEAESFLINSEGRVCVRFYRCKDGTVITQNCPVGWQKAKKRISRITTAVFSSVIGLFSGIFAFNLINFDDSDLRQKVVVNENTLMGGYMLEEEQVINSDKVRKQIRRRKAKKNNKMIEAPRDYVDRIEDKPVVAWIK